MSHFKEFRDTVDNYIIQRAEIVLDGVEGVTKTTSLPPTMAYYITSEDSLANGKYDIGLTLQNNSGATTFASYSEKENAYINDITLGLSSLITQDEYNQLILGSVVDTGFKRSGGSSIVTPSTRYLNRLVVPKDGIHIRFYYSIPDKKQ